VHAVADCNRLGRNRPGWSTAVSFFSLFNCFQNLF
jgi:hypothetical protein